jgi:hypothetical protein
MPTPDDEQFEAYLKQFRPAAPAALPATTPVRKRSIWRLSALIATAAAIIVLAIVVTRSQHKQIATNVPVKSDGPTHIAADAPLTMRNANKLLADAPSFKSAVDDLAFKSERIPLAKNEQSAIHVLGKEKIKL